MSFNSNTNSVQNYLKSFNNSADALAGITAVETFFNDINISNAVDMLATIGKILATMKPQIEEVIKIAGHIPGFDATLFFNNVYKLDTSTVVTENLGDTLAAIVGDLASITAAVGSTESGAALLGVAVGGPFVVGIAAVGILASVYSSYCGLQNLAQLEEIRQWGIKGLSDFTGYMESGALWSGYQSEVYQDYFEQNPATLPAMLLAHIIDKNITPGGVRYLIERSGVSNRSDQHIPEVSNFIASINPIRCAK